MDVTGMSECNADGGIWLGTDNCTELCSARGSALM